MNLRIQLTLGFVTALFLGGCASGQSHLALPENTSPDYQALGRFRTAGQSEQASAPRAEVCVAQNSAH